MIINQKKRWKKAIELQVRKERDLAGKKSWSEWECDWEGTWDRGGLAVMMGRWERGKKWELCYVMGEGRGCEAGNKEREKREL